MTDWLIDWLAWLRAVLCRMPRIFSHRYIYVKGGSMPLGLGIATWRSDNRNAFQSNDAHKFPNKPTSSHAHIRRPHDLSLHVTNADKRHSYSFSAIPCVSFGAFNITARRVKSQLPEVVCAPLICQMFPFMHLHLTFWQTAFSRPKCCPTQNKEVLPHPLACWTAWAE